MRCDRAQAAISARMDGEHLPSRLIGATEAHVATCSACAAFAGAAQRVRASVRIRTSEPVPDLVEPIMAAVALTPRSETLPHHEPSVRRTAAPPVTRRRQRRNLAPVAAALVIGLVAGSLAVGGPWSRQAPEVARALEVRRNVLDEASRLTSFSARFAVTERNYADVSGEGQFNAAFTRRFDLRVRLSGPERFHLELRDRTDYPDDTWVANDLTYIVNRGSSFVVGPSVCAPGLEAACPEQQIIVTDRLPFSPTSPVPSDLILPVSTVSGLEGTTIQGQEVLLGDRRAVRIELPYERAAPLFPFLDLFSSLGLEGGSQWRSFYSGDQVVLWLDAETWFPLRSQIYAADVDDRRRWETLFNLTKELPERPLLTVEARSFSRERNPASEFRIPDDGARRVTEHAAPLPVERAERRLSFDVDAIGAAAGLDRYRAVITSSGGNDQVIVAYSKGLSWLKVGESTDWHGPTPLGVGVAATSIRVPGDGIGYFAPGTDLTGRRLSIHAPRSDLVLETNLPRARLLRVASALPFAGQPVPEAWRPAT